MPRFQPPGDLHRVAQHTTNTVTPLKPSCDSFIPGHAIAIFRFPSQCLRMQSLLASLQHEAFRLQSHRMIAHLWISAPGQESFLSWRQRLGACFLPPSPHFPIIKIKITPVYQAPLPPPASPLDALKPISQACSPPAPFATRPRFDSVLQIAPFEISLPSHSQIATPAPPPRGHQRPLHFQNPTFTYVPSYPIT